MPVSWKLPLDRLIEKVEDINIRQYELSTRPPQSPAFPEAPEAPAAPGSCPVGVGASNRPSSPIYLIPLLHTVFPHMTVDLCLSFKHTLKDESL